jgi:hemolysin III
MTGADRIQAMGQEVGDRLRDTVEEIKPRLRGWLHTVTVPLSLAAGIVLVALSPGGEARLGSVVFAVTSVLLFTVSAIYHTPAWGRRVHGVLQRIDHANIFLLIAGTYTPFALLLLDDGSARVLLTIVWAGAFLGVAFRTLWTRAPRWLYVPIYLALGWSAAFWAADFAASANAAVLTLMIVGGLLYSLGGLVYGLKKPDPLPRWFGFHEVFHALTVAAFVVHYVGISIATYTV